MLANYHDKTYRYIPGKGKIITRLPYKAEKDFKRDGEALLFFKRVPEKELTDIFDVEFWVEYDTGLPNTPSMWQIKDGDNKLEDGTIRLRFAEGILPGWETEEKNVCVKHIDALEAKNTKVVYIYKKKDGEELDVPQREEMDVSLYGFIMLYRRYRRTNL